MRKPVFLSFYPRRRRASLRFGGETRRSVGSHPRRPGMEPATLRCTDDAPTNRATPPGYRDSGAPHFHPPGGMPSPPGPAHPATATTRQSAPRAGGGPACSEAILRLRGWFIKETIRGPTPGPCRQADSQVIPSASLPRPTGPEYGDAPTAPAPSPGWTVPLPALRLEKPQRDTPGRLRRNQTTASGARRHHLGRLLHRTSSTTTGPAGTTPPSPPPAPGFPSGCDRAQDERPEMLFKTRERGRGRGHYPAPKTRPQGRTLLLPYQLQRVTRPSAQRDAKQHLDRTGAQLRGAGGRRCWRRLRNRAPAPLRAHPLLLPAEADPTASELASFLCQRLPTPLVPTLLGL